MQGVNAIGNIAWLLKGIEGICKHLHDDETVSIISLPSLYGHYQTLHIYKQVQSIDALHQN